MEPPGWEVLVVFMVAVFVVAEEQEQEMFVEEPAEYPLYEKLRHITLYSIRSTRTRRRHHGIRARAPLGVPLLL